MSDKTSIEWTDATWNPTRGCTRISPGCGGPGPHGGCYAERVAARFSGPGQPYEGLAHRVGGEARWTGKITTGHNLEQPLRWKRPRKIFVNSMSDLFHENIPDAEIDKIFAVMAMCPHHTFQILTKRPERMRQWFDVFGGAEMPRDRVIGAMYTLGANFAAIPWPLPNVCLGVSVENQTAADERIPLLLDTLAAIRWISAEPLLSSLDIAWALSRNPIEIASRFLKRGRFSPGLERLKRLDWVVAGGESGYRARPMHPDWARSIRDQCAEAGVPFFFKQWGEHVPVGHIDRGTATDPNEFAWERVGKKAAGSLLDGVEHKAFPVTP